MAQFILTFYTPNDPWRFWIALLFCLIQIVAIGAFIYRHLDAVKRAEHISSLFRPRDPWESKILTSVAVGATLPTLVWLVLILIANF